MTRFLIVFLLSVLLVASWVLVGILWIQRSKVIEVERTTERGALGQLTKISWMKGGNKKKYEGPVISYYTNGKIWSIGMNRDDREDGWRLTFYDNGEIQEASLYDRGMLLRIFGYDRSGNEITNMIFNHNENWMGFIHLSYNGKTAIYKNGVQVGFR